MKQVEEISATLLKLATPGMNRKDLLKAVRAEHPKASKKDIVRAAFFALIESADADLDKAKRLQQFALSERGGMYEDARH